jgi:hypothetical protein
MPKTEIDYSNTIIYKITCNDSNISDIYVGHTTNFVQRKYSHKQNCINDKSPNHKCKVYDVIRNNGGWDNWNMEIINFFNCHDHYEARQKEQEYFISLGATLNSVEPLSSKPSLNKSVKINKEEEDFLLRKEVLSTLKFSKSLQEFVREQNKIMMELYKNKTTKI